MRDAVATAVVSMLNGGGVLAGRGNKPSGGGWSGAPGQSAFTSYAIVWMIGSKDLVHRDLDGGWTEARPNLHVRTVGGTSQEAAQLLDDVDDLFRGETLTVPGYDLVNTVFDSSFSDAKDDDVEPPEYYAGSNWRIWLQETS